MEIELTEEEFGQRGGTYYFLENEHGKFIRVSDMGLKIAEEKMGRGKRKTYKVRCPEKKTIYSFDFTSNSRNRNLSVYLYSARDFRYDKHPKPIRSYWDEEEISRFIDKFRLSDKQKNAIIEYKSLQPLIKNLVEKSPKDWLNAPPATEEAILRHNSYLVSALAMSKHGSVPTSLNNIIKYFKQLYEIKAIVDGFDAEVEKLDLSRRWSYFPYNAPNIKDLPIDAIKFLQITFSNPNFIIKTEDAYYTIWYEFSLAKGIRPDFFILEGKHETPFREEIYDFLLDVGKDFGREIIDPWRLGFLRAYNKNVCVDTPSKEAVQEFLEKLAKYLKKGLVIESKEDRKSFRTRITQRQLITYPKVFSNQGLLLLSWVEVPSSIRGFDIIDKFNVDAESAKRLTDYVKGALG